MVSMPAQPPFTRREGDQLARRVDEIDRDGGRALVRLTGQVSETAATVGRLEKTVETWLRGHERAHEQEAERELSRRRFRVTVGIAAAAAAVTALGLLFAIAVQVAHLPG